MAKRKRKIVGTAAAAGAGVGTAAGTGLSSALGSGFATALAAANVASNGIGSALGRSNNVGNAPAPATATVTTMRAPLQKRLSIACPLAESTQRTRTSHSATAALRRARVALAAVICSRGDQRILHARQRRAGMREAMMRGRASLHYFKAKKGSEGEPSTLRGASQRQWRCPCATYSPLQSLQSLSRLR